MTEKDLEQRNELYRHALDVCGSFNLRKATRAVTQLYDDILQPSGLRSTQVVILLNLGIQEEMSVSRLARELHLSPSTLTRNLQPLERDGLIKKSKRGKRGNEDNSTWLGSLSKLISATTPGATCQEKAPVW